MKQTRRWMTSVLNAAAQPQPALPFARAARRAAVAKRALAAAKPAAKAAH
jgi:hypothetical protein